MSAGWPGECRENPWKPAGEKLFQAKRLRAPAIVADGTGLGPSLLGVYGQSGETYHGRNRHGRRRLHARVHPASRRPKSFWATRPSCRRSRDN